MEHQRRLFATLTASNGIRTQGLQLCHRGHLESHRRRRRLERRRARKKIVDVEKINTLSKNLFFFFPGKVIYRSGSSLPNLGWLEGSSNRGNSESLTDILLLRYCMVMHHLINAATFEISYHSTDHMKQASLFLWWRHSKTISLAHSEFPLL